MLTNCKLYTPDDFGRGDVLIVGEFILKFGKINHKGLAHSGLDVEVVDLKDKIVIPGIIDPHSHILGGSGESGGFSSQTPEISASEYIRGGITTVVGTLGVDTTMKTMAGLLGKVKGLNDEGISAFLYSGGYAVPPSSIMEHVKTDVMFISEVIGAGEIAISDERSHEPTTHDLAKLVTEVANAGKLTDKAGVTHFHTGKSETNLKPLRDLLGSNHAVKAEWLYPTHVQDRPSLMAEAIALTKKGSFIDFDVVEGGLAKHLKTYREKGGTLSKLTVSSDSSITSPSNIWDQVSNCVLHHRFKLETILPLVTSNPAEILKFRNRGKIKSGYEANLLAVDKNNLEITDVFSKGNHYFRDGKLDFTEKFLKGSNRNIQLKGDKAKSLSE